MNKITAKQAKWWEPQENDKVLCTLCPRYCLLNEGQSGFCYIRKNVNGELFTSGYGRPTGFAIDPIEKKPLYHFLPGSDILSFGTVGCNLGCKFCQNWSTSKSKNDELSAVNASPEDVVKLALQHNTPSIAYTYNDPTIIGEYVIDVSKLARESGIKNVMVTAGYIDKEARKDVYQNIDAANVDLKGFTEDFYYKLTGAHLENVLDTLKWLKNETGVWIELTTLLIPGYNTSEDDIKRECDWILNNLGAGVPIHFSAFYPAYKLMNVPATPESLVKRIRDIALSEGLKYVYTGNINNPEGEATYCHKCKKKIITRGRMWMEKISIKEGNCSYCGEKLEGIF